MTTSPSTTSTTAKTAAPRRPAAGTGTTPSGAAAKPEARSTSLQSHLTVLTECDVMTPEGFYAWAEALRALTSGMAFFVHASASQFEQAARKGARDNVDGRMTMAQKLDMTRTMRRIGRALNAGAAENLLATATQAARAYGLLEDFLEGLESDNVARPHRSAKGGFNLYGGK